MREKTIKIFETHAHYDDSKYDEDRDIILDILHSNGVNKIVNIACNRESIKNSLSLANRYDFIYSTIGFHPCDCDDMHEEDIIYMEELCSNKKVVAIGEIGLDYYWDDVEKEVQKYWFIKQLELAVKTNKPIVIHSRDAAKDTQEILFNYNIKGVMHCFSYSYEVAREYVSRGYYIGVGGVSTFKNAKNIQNVIKNIPLENIVIETDSPYLSPEPFRGKRNNSANLTFIIDKISSIKNIDRQKVIEVTYKNALDLYNLED